MSAGTGMGLLSDAIFTELGYFTESQGRQRALETLASVQSSWPRESFSGFFDHFVDFSEASGWSALGEYSTVDSAELALGALFVGNYFGGNVSLAAHNLAKATAWSKAISAPTDPTIFPVVNGTTGHFSGNIRPYNEYFLVAYIAAAVERSSVAQQYFANFYKTANNEQCTYKSSNMNRKTVFRKAFKDRHRLDLDHNNIKPNSGLRQLSKQILNTFCG